VAAYLICLFLIPCLCNFAGVNSFSSSRFCFDENAQVGGITNWEYVLCASVGRGGAELQVARWHERENDSHAAEHDRSYLRVLGR